MTPLSSAPQSDVHDAFKTNPTGVSLDDPNKGKKESEEVANIMEAIRKAHDEARMELDLGREMMVLAIKELEKLTADVMGMGEVTDKSNSTEMIPELLGRM